MPSIPRTRTLSRAILPGLLAGLSLLVVLRVWILGAYRIPSPSMAPGLLVGDTVLVDKLAYRSRPPDRGDVIVFQRPGDENASVKRVIGLPGERVELRNNAVLVNGRELRRVTIGDVTFDQSGVVIHRPVELPERTLFEESDGGRRWQVVQLRQTPPQSGAWTVPSESVFVLGDNRDASQDSRVPGAAPVRLTDVVGRVDRVMFSRATTGFRSRWWGPVR